MQIWESEFDLRKRQNMCLVLLREVSFIELCLRAKLTKKHGKSVR